MSLVGRRSEVPVYINKIY
ncbi:MAG: hypothetical protein QME57_05205 [Patescibacteria group bacterium]|nr:hypothetical protein [Patescibacteria group bacterium]